MPRYLALYLNPGGESTEPPARPVWTSAAGESPHRPLAETAPVPPWDGGGG